jgi:hypothetical protein
MPPRRERPVAPARWIAIAAQAARGWVGRGNKVPTGPEIKTAAVPARTGSYVRIRGNLEQAWIETAPPPREWPGEAVLAERRWRAKRVSGIVQITPDGRVGLYSANLDDEAMRRLGDLCSDALRDTRMILPDGQRYRGDGFVALDRAHAERLAARGRGGMIIDDAQLRHVGWSGDWAFWSDGTVTTTRGLPAWTRDTRGMTRVADALIGNVWESRSGPPKVGWDMLARYVGYIGMDVVQDERDSGRQQRENIVRLRVALTGGDEAEWFVREAEDGRGRDVEVATSLRDLSEGEAQLQSRAR